MNRNRVVSGLTFCTVVRHGPFARARTLADSGHAPPPGAAVFVLVLDPPVDGANGGEFFSTIALEEVGLPDLARQRFLCSAAGLARVVKPSVLAHLLASDAHNLIYADPGLVLTADLRHLEHRLVRHPIVVAPHLAALPGAVEDAGADNPAFVALARGAVADAYLGWWRRQVEGSAPTRANASGGPSKRGSTPCLE